VTISQSNNEEKNKKSLCKKPKKEGNKMGLGKEILRSAALVIAQKIITSRTNGKSWTPHGFANKLLKEAKKSLPGLNMNLFNYSIKKLNVSNHENSVVVINPDATMMSSLRVALQVVNPILLLQTAPALIPASHQK
jgi:hypothetical protein